MTSSTETDKGDDMCRAGKGESLDLVLGGRLRLLQSEPGYRFTIDSLLLAGFAGVAAGESIVDLGTGNGIVALLLGARKGAGQVTGVEMQADLAALARRNVLLNSLSSVVKIIEGDIRRIESLLPAGSSDVVVFNPPYRRRGSGRINPLPQKAIARHELTATLSDFLVAARHLLPDSGRVCAVYPASRMVELFHQFRRFRIEPKRVRLVYSRSELPAEFVLLEAIKAAGEELEVLSPLTIYRDKGLYSAAAENFFTDLAATIGSSGEETAPLIPSPYR